MYARYIRSWPARTARSKAHGSSKAHLRIVGAGTSPAPTIFTRPRVPDTVPAGIPVLALRARAALRAHAPGRGPTHMREFVMRKKMLTGAAVGAGPTLAHT